ncbi:MAG: hypothetical protein CMK09_03485 [Ponticaulis sp.]|nr:hypothetical protein [Ponticaulis sp.]|tara:strand:+ start:10693 stop:11133 length:441 start_codon:yes stop_codon:yes gene_type:complete
MTLAYPIANSAMQALTEPLGHERTQAAARKAAAGPVTFETEWLRPGPERQEDLQPYVQSAVAMGAAQIYETEKGRPVIALNYWRVMTEAEQVFDQPVATDPARKREDHTDNLYFRRGRTKPKKKPVDPNQLDLFGADPTSSDKENS